MSARRLLVALTAVALTGAGTARADYQYVGQFGGAGTGDGQFTSVLGLAADAGGRVFALDGTQSGPRLEVFRSDGTFVRTFPVQGSVENSAPNQLAARPDGDTLLLDIDVSSTNGYCSGPQCAWHVEEYDVSGQQVARWPLHLPDGSWDDEGSNAQAGLALTPSGDVLTAGSQIFGLDCVAQGCGFGYTGDYQFQGLVRYSSSGGFVSQFGISQSCPPGGPQPCPDPAYTGDQRLAADGTPAAAGSPTTLYMLGSDGVDMFDLSGNFIHSFGPHGSGDGQLSSPTDIAVDPGTGHVFVADSGRVEEFDSAGVFIQTIGAGGTGQLHSPASIAVDSSGDLLVSDTDASNQRTIVKVFADTGKPTIVSGPQTPTGETSARFTFTLGPGLTAECSLDGGAYGACSSGVTYANVSGGQHTFRVRSVDGTGHRSAAAQWVWTVDTTAPTVTIDAAPSGVGNPSDVTVKFHGSENGLAFTCSLDGATPEPCASPWSIGGLSDGAHSLSIVATDAVGNASAPAVVSWSVQASAPTQSSQPGAPPGSEPGAGGQSDELGANPDLTEECPAGRVAQATSGKLVMHGAGGTCLQAGTAGGAGEKDRTVWLAHGPVYLNGIRIVPDDDVLVMLSRDADTGRFETTGKVSVQLGNLPAAPIPRAIHWSVGADGGLNADDKNDPLVAGNVIGLSAESVLPSITFSTQEGGSAVLKIPLTLPKFLRGSPEAEGENATESSALSHLVGVKLQASTSNEKGFHLGGAIKVGELWLGPVKLEELELSYDGFEGVMEGSVGVALGSPLAEGPVIKLAVTIGPPTGPTILPPCCLQSLKAIVEHINKPIPETPLFLQSIGGNISRNEQGNLSLGGTIGVSLGPEVTFPVAGRMSVLSVVGGLQLTLSDPWVLEASGQVNILVWQLAGANVTYTFGKSVQLSGAVDLAVPFFGGLHASVDHTFIDQHAVNIQASGTVTFGSGFTAQGSAVFSTKGYAACAEVDTAAGHLAAGWGQRYESATPDVLASVCDLGPYTDAPSAGAPTERQAASTSLVRRVTLTRGHGERVFAVHGTGGAPSLTLTGPGGISLAADPAHVGPQPAGLAMQDPHDATTYLLLPSSPAGTYVLTSADHAIASVQVAGELPPVKLKVSTRGVPGGNRHVTWSGNPAGSQLSLYESAGRSGGPLIAQSTRGRGSATYTPRPGLGARRRIYAVVTNSGGLVRDTRYVAPYSVDERVPGRVTKLRRDRHRRLVWRATPRARGYVVAITAGGVTTSTTTRATHVRAPRGSLLVTVVALDAAGRAGPAATLRVK